mgnify:CR=1 FL=1
MADIKIIVDSGSDIPQDIADKYNIGVISFLSIFGTEQYVQRTEITNEQFFDKLEEYDGIPTTSQHRSVICLTTLNSSVRSMRA